MDLRRRRSDLAWLAGGTVVLAAASVFAGLASVPHAEVSAFRSVNDLPGAIWPTAWAPMQFGTYALTPVVALIALLARRARLAAELLIAGSAAYWGAKAMKPIVDRARPGALLPGVNLRGVGITGGGFPSGHAAVSAALAFVLFAWLPRPWGWTAVTLAALVSFLRIYTGAHLPLDVVGGAALGVAVAAATTWCLKAPGGEPAD